MKHSFKKLLLILIFLFCFVLSSCDYINEDSNNGVVEIKVSENTSNTTTLEEAIEKASKSVVVISASTPSGISRGSGVLIGTNDDLSFIVTCCHVVESANQYEIITSDGMLYNGTLVGADPICDLAVLSIPKTDLGVATFVNNSDNINIGSDAIAIGNPLGTLGGTVTKGIVSAKGRSIKMSDGSVHNLIQTDASINSGNSGGGLFNNLGELIGIVSAKYSATGVEGLGFAIPANQVRVIITDLIELGYVEGRTSLGVTFSDGYYRTGYFYGDYYKVVYVSYVDPNGSSYGLLLNDDIITNVKVEFSNNSKPTQTLGSIGSASDIELFLDSLKLSIKDKIIFTIKRGNYNANEVEVEVVLRQYIYK